MKKILILLLPLPSLLFPQQGAAVSEDRPDMSLHTALLNARDAYLQSQDKYHRPKDRAILRKQCELISAHMETLTPERSPVPADPAAAHPVGPHGEAVAWLRDDGLEHPVAVITDRIKRVWLAANANQVERYTIPLGRLP